MKVAVLGLAGTNRESGKPDTDMKVSSGSVVWALLITMFSDAIIADNVLHLPVPLHRALTVGEASYLVGLSVLEFVGLLLVFGLCAFLFGDRASRA